MSELKCRRWAVKFAVVVMGFAVNGCGTGPLSVLAPLSPAVRRQWAEDEQHGLMFRQRIEGIESLGRQAPKMPLEDAEKTGRDMAHLVQNDPNPLVRRAAVAALANFPPPTGDAGLAAALKDEETLVRVAACQAWGRRQDEAALSALTRTLDQDPHKDVKLAAARALGNFRDPQAVQALGGLLKSPDPALQVRAMESLKGISGQDFNGDLKAWQQYVDSGQAPTVDAPSLAERLRRLF